MADSADEPDWSLLPHDPVKFFGLTSGFELRELKRSYNQLIRRYKPERFPQEFQRIRAAYEQLEEAIRYGQSTDPVAAPMEGVDWLAQAAGRTTGQADGVPHERLVPLYERIQTGSVSTLYRELRDKASKSPYDYYALAIMSDVVDRQDGRQFANWLLQGLVEYPGEVGLSRLLHAYFRSPIEFDHCQALLLACSKMLPEEAFFPFTEPLWRTLLRGPDFKRFSDTLRKCERNLKGININNRLVFYLLILKPAVWLADLAWIEEAFRYVEQNYDRLPKYFEYDLEILTRLRAYRSVREQLIQSNELHAQLDRAMQDYFSEDQLKGDQSVLSCQVQLAQDTSRLAAAFSNFGNDAYAAFYAVWIWVSYDVGERHVEPPKENLDPTIWQPRTATMLSQIETQTVASRWGVKWATRRVLFRASQAASIFFAATLLSVVGVGIAGFVSDMFGVHHSDDPVLIIAVLVGVGGGVYVGFKLAKRIEKKYWVPFTLRISAECYRQMWRREILSFLARSQLSYQTFRAFVHSVGSKATSAAWVKHYVDQDYTLPLFAIAQRFVV